MKKQKAKKISTVDGLARLMQDEFVRVNERFDGVDKRFDGVDKRFDGVDKRFDGVEVEFANVHKRMGSFETNLRGMQESSSELFAKLDEFISLYRNTKQELVLLARQFRRLEARVAQLETRR